MRDLPGSVAGGIQFASQLLPTWQTGARELGNHAVSWPQLIVERGWQGYATRQAAAAGLQTPGRAMAGGESQWAFPSCLQRN